MAFQGCFESESNPVYAETVRRTIEVSVLTSNSENPREHLKNFSNVNCDQHNNVQVPVVQKVDSAIHWINHHPVDNVISFRYPTF